MNLKSDLHTHTTFSDGYYSPAELLHKAVEKGIGIISITDHDSVSGVKAAREFSTKIGIEIIPGVEISTEIGENEIHILGYFIDPDNKELERYLVFFREERYKRAIRIVEKLNIIGIGLKMDDVLLKAKDSSIGRPHIAQALLEKGFVNSFFEAFNKYIGNNGPAFEKKVHLSPQSACKIINDAGGLSFIAHPGKMPENLIQELIEAGIDGIEVIHPSHSASLSKYYKGITNEYFLLESGGSDFHGGKREDEGNLGKYFTNQKAIEAMRSRLIKNTA
jgi:3',5'-nucleoside bisphosphate phosphatase